MEGAPRPRDECCAALSSGLDEDVEVGGGAALAWGGGLPGCAVGVVQARQLDPAYDGHLPGPDGGAEQRLSSAAGEVECLGRRCSVVRGWRGGDGMRCGRVKMHGDIG